MTEPIDFQTFKAERDIDPEFIMVDDFGRKLYAYALSYDFDGSTWGGISVWAYSMEDAQNRVNAMRENLILLGQIGGIIQA
jgi:hypothetical protein